MPPQGVTLVVALMTFAASLIPLVWIRLLLVGLPQWLQMLALWGLILVFLGRGLITYTPIAARYSVVEPFQTLNRKYYSPLCVLLGLCLLVLAL